MTTSKAASTPVLAPLVSKTNVRYITGSASRKDGTVVAIKFRVFAENTEILKAVVSRLTKLKKTGAEGKLTTSKYSGWDLKGNVYYSEFITRNRKEFQDAFKAAKNAAIEAGRNAREAIVDNDVTKLAKTIANDAKKTALKKKK